MRGSSCQQCGMALDHPGTFHPYMFCLLKKAQPLQDPWVTFVGTCKLAGLDTTHWPKRAPLVRDLQQAIPTQRQEGNGA